MEKLNEIEMANSEENDEVLIQNNAYHCEQIMPQVIARPKIISYEIQEDEHRNLENIVSRVAVHNVLQYGTIIFQPLKELHQRNRSSNEFQAKYNYESSSNMSSKNNMLKENQDYALDLSISSPLDLRISKDYSDIYSTDNDIQNSIFAHVIDERDIHTTSNTLQGSIYDHDTEKPSCSYDSNINLKPIINPSLSVKKPLSCEICNKKYTKKVSLKTHLLIHTGEKPFICSVCNKQFNQKSNLKRHMLTHSGQKPFSCRTCNRRFTQKQNLDDHKMTHTGEKPHKCHFCEKKV